MTATFHLAHDGITLDASPRRVAFCQSCESYHVDLLEHPTPEQIAHLAGELLRLCPGLPADDPAEVARNLCKPAEVDVFDAKLHIYVALGFLKLATHAAREGGA